MPHDPSPTALKTMPKAITIVTSDFGSLVVLAPPELDMPQAMAAAQEVVANLKADGGMDDLDAVLVAFENAGFQNPMFETLDADEIAPAARQGDVQRAP